MHVSQSSKTSSDSQVRGNRNAAEAPKNETRGHSTEAPSRASDLATVSGEANSEESSGASPRVDSLVEGLGGWTPSADHSDHADHPSPSFEELRENSERALSSESMFSMPLGPETRAVALETSAFSPHAQAVTSILREEGNLEPEQVETRPVTSFASPEMLTAEGSASPSERLDTMIELGAANGLSALNGQLEVLADQNSPELQGVNVSAGMSTLSQFMNLNTMSVTEGENGERTLTPEGEVIFDALGLPHDTSAETMRRFTELGIERIQDVVDGSPLVGEQRERHADVSLELQEQGVHYVVAAGNEGNFLAALQAEGMRVPDSADDSYFSNPHNFTVGSLDNQGTVSPSDDSLFTQTSMSPEVDLLAPGVNREVESFGQTGYWTGTSFAAPDALAELITLSDQNPEMSVVEVQELLRSNSGPVQGTSLTGLR